MEEYRDANVDHLKQVVYSLDEVREAGFGEELGPYPVSMRCPLVVLGIGFVWRL